MSSAVKTLTFAARWPNIALWHVVYLYAAAGRFRAEYMSGSERQSGSLWEYDFLVFDTDLPSPMTLDDVKSSNIINPFVEAFGPCQPVQTSCYGSIPTLPNGTDYKLAVIVGPNECGAFCLMQTPAPDQYQHGGTWIDHPGQPAPP